MTPQELRDKRIADLASDGWRPATEEERENWLKGKWPKVSRLYAGIGLVVRIES